MSNHSDNKGSRCRGALALGLPLLVAALPSAAWAAPAAPGGSGTLVAIAFWALALVTIASAAGVAFSRNILYSSFSLLGAFLGVAGLFVFLSADFLAVAQLLIYVGGVLVLILFAVMLTSRIESIHVSNRTMGLVPAAVATVATTALLLFVSIAAPWKGLGNQPQMRPTAEALGDLFLSRYLLPFEIASVVLLAVLIGSVVLARKEIKPD